MSSRTLKSVFFRAGPLAALTILLWVSQSGAVGDSKTNWFKYSGSIDLDWKVEPHLDDPLRVDVQPRTMSRGAPLYRILVLYPRPSSAYDIAITQILSQFKVKGIAASFTVLNFEMKNERGLDALRLAESENFNLIFAMGSESTAWLFERYRGGRIPVVSVCSKDPVQLGQMPDYQSGSNTNFAFTSLNVPVEVQMAYVKELKPDLKNLTVLVDSKNVSAVQTQAEPIAAYARQRGIQVLWGAVQNPAKARDELVPIIRDAVHTMRKSDPDLSKSLFWITGSTSVFLEIQTINESADRVPVISVVPEIVRDGLQSAVLAIGISFESNAMLAAVYGAEILAGRAKPGDLKVGVVSPPDIAINFAKAREIGLRVPFSFFEAASSVYDYEGRRVRPNAGKALN